jgi:hypothetical protein
MPGAIKRIQKAKEGAKPSIAQKVISDAKHPFYNPPAPERPDDYIQEVILQPSDYDKRIEYDMDAEGRRR